MADDFSLFYDEAEFYPSSAITQDEFAAASTNADGTTADFTALDGASPANSNETTPNTGDPDGSYTAAENAKFARQQETGGGVPVDKNSSVFQNGAFNLNNILNGLLTAGVKGGQQAAAQQFNNIAASIISGANNNISQQLASIGGSGTGVGTNVITGAQLLNLVKIGIPSQTSQSVLPNPLNDYESYTYSLSLHLLSTQQYNNLVSSPEQAYVPSNVLVASAGKYGALFGRNPNFQEDFFFEDLKINTVINTTKRSRNSNMVECSFTIIEPLGFTFINRLVAAVNQIGGQNYLRQPYLLQIDFYGYQDGVVTSTPISGLTKYLPITMIGMKTRVTHKGTEYRIEAAPYNHQALNEQHVVSPATFQVKAVTVADMFGSGTASNQLINAFAQTQREQAVVNDLQSQIQTSTNLDARDVRVLQQKLDAAAKPSGVFQVSGFCDALNAWFIGLRDVNKKILVTNTYRVEFHPDIGNQAIIPPGPAPNNLASAAAGGATTQQGQIATKAAGGLAVGQIEWNSGLFNIPMGTQIDKLIDYTVRNSEYIRQQLADPEAGIANDYTQTQTKLGNPLRWYRIIPKVLVKQYDPARRQYGLEITYYVKPWTVSSKDPSAPQGRVPGYVKKYNYIYTGQNKDVIDLSLDFDMLYYQQLGAYQNNKRDGETGEKIALPINPNSVLGGPNIVQQDPVQQVPVNYIAFDYRTQSRTGPYQAAAGKGGDIQRDLFTTARGDMINIKMRIIGDPHFIKQDDVFYGQSINTAFSALTPNNSLYTDNGELYVYVEFQSPDDYDETTGLAVPGSGFYSYNLFKGIYKVISVDNTFTKGKFEQTLDLVRVPISDELRNQITGAAGRAESYINLGLGQLAALPFARFTGPRILLNSVNTSAANYSAVNGSDPGSQLSSLLGGIAQQALGAIAQKFGGQLLSATKDFFGSFGSSGLAPGAVGGGAESVFDTTGTSAGSFAAGDYIPSSYTLGAANDLTAAGDYSQAYAGLTNDIGSAADYASLYSPETIAAGVDVGLGAADFGIDTVGGGADFVGGDFGLNF